MRRFCEIVGEADVFSNAVVVVVIFCCFSCVAFLAVLAELGSGVLVVNSAGMVSLLQVTSMGMLRTSWFEYFFPYFLSGHLLGVVAVGDYLLLGL